MKVDGGVGFDLATAEEAVSRIDLDGGAAGALIDLSESEWDDVEDAIEGDPLAGYEDPAQLGGQGATGRGVDVGDHHPGAEPGQPAGDPGADTVCAAGHQSHRRVQLHCRLPWVTAR